MKLLITLLVILLISPFTLISSLNNGIGLTPALGWSSWNYFWTDINETLIHDIAQSIVDSGLHDLGWEYINIDGGWALHDRDTNGSIQADPKLFPSGMKAMGDYIHNLGLKFGLYSDISDNTCAGAPGGYGHYEHDAKIFADWGVDYLKVDYCGGFGNSTLNQWDHWAALRDALNDTGRQIYYSICPKTLAPATGNSSPYKGTYIYSPPLNWTLEDHRNLSNSWLIEYVNIVDNWYSTNINCQNAGGPCGMITNLDSIVQMTHSEFVLPGGWNDADMLQVCNLGYHNGGMSNDEYRSHMSVWAVLSSPLILSMDIRQWNKSKELQDCLQYSVMNKDVVAINQDKSGYGGGLLYQVGNSTLNITEQIWGKQLDNGGWAIVLLNRADKELSMLIWWELLGWSEKDEVQVFDVWEGKDIGIQTGSFNTTVMSHGVVMITLTRT